MKHNGRLRGANGNWKWGQDGDVGSTRMYVPGKEGGPTDLGGGLPPTTDMAAARRRFEAAKGAEAIKAAQLGLEEAKAARTGKVSRFTRAAFRRVVDAWGGGWCTNLMRHTRVSYRLAQTRNPVLVASEGGHTQEVMHRHYANLRLKAADVASFWRIGP